MGLWISPWYFPLVLPITTERKNERLMVALKGAHIGRTPNVGLIGNAPWREVMFGPSGKPKVLGTPTVTDQWIRMWLMEKVSDTTLERRLLGTHSGLRNLPTWTFDSVYDLVNFAIRTVPSLTKEARDIESELREGAYEELDEFPSFVVNPHEWIDLKTDGKSVLLKQKPGLSLHMYGSEEDEDKLDPYLLLEMSDAVKEMVGYHKNSIEMRRDVPIILDDVSPKLKVLGNRHLMMEGCEYTSVNGQYCPLLYSLMPERVDHKPKHLQYRPLKDLFNSGGRSERHQLRFWLEDSSGEKCRLQEYEGEPAEITLDLQWRKVIMRPTAV